MVAVTIDFYEKNVGGVQLLQEADGFRTREHNQWLEATLFACFAIRQFRALGKHPSSNGLARSLSTWTPSAKQKEEPSEILATLEPPLLSAAPLPPEQFVKVYLKMHDQKLLKLVLVGHKGKGMRRFLGRLSRTDKGVMFILDTSGFGLGLFLGLDMPLLATNSVMLFLSFLAIKNSNEDGYDEALKVIAKGCADAYRMNKITIANQERLAQSIVQSAIKQ